MKGFLWFVAVAALAAAPASAQTSARAYDWLLGSWSCSNTVPSMMGGPARQTRTFAQSNAPNALSMHVTGAGFERFGYLAYDPVARVWRNPFAYPSGNYASETTTATGKKRFWSGVYYNVATRATIPVRDTYVSLSPVAYTDVGQYLQGGVWKTGYSGTCTKVAGARRRIL